MQRPLYLLSALAAAFLGGAAAVAEEASSTLAVVKEADAATARPVASPLISSMISAGLPKYGELKSPDAPVVPAGAAPTAPESSSATIVHLPAVIVHDRKLPDKSEVLTKHEMARQGMDTYIGPENGIDRGFLNLFTVAELWHHLPILGRYKFEGFETNEERGLRLYQEARLREEMEELSGLTSLGRKADSPAPASKPADK
jgi:hypothetical protein